MKFQSLVLILALNLFTDNLAFAQEIEWLKPYLKAKEINCSLSTAQMKEQVTSHLDGIIQQMGERLRAKGSEFEAIQQDRNNVELDPVPGQPVFDFFVREVVTVVIRQYSFQLQTTYIDAEGMKTEKKLWFPLTIADPGEGKPCKLERIALAENQRKFLPRVDLAIGEPPRIVATDLVQVMDISAQPTSGHAPGPAAAPSAQATAKAAERAPKATPPPEEKTPPKKSERESPKRSESREDRREKRRAERRESRREEYRERREERRERRYKERERRRGQRRQRAEENVQQQNARTPEKQNDCTGDLSPWKAIGCAVTGNK